MAWGTIETEPEFVGWYATLNDHDAATADFHVDLLEREGVHLGEPYTRQLSGTLRDLRFHLGARQMRVSYNAHRAGELSC